MFKKSPFRLLTKTALVAFGLTVFLTHAAQAQFGNPFGGAGGGGNPFGGGNFNLFGGSSGNKHASNRSGAGSGGMRMAAGNNFSKNSLGPPSRTSRSPFNIPATANRGSANRGSANLSSGRSGGRDMLGTTSKPFGGAANIRASRSVPKQSQQNSSGGTAARRPSTSIPGNIFTTVPKNQASDRVRSEKPIAKSKSVDVKSKMDMRTTKTRDAFKTGGREPKSSTLSQSQAKRKIEQSASQSRKSKTTGPERKTITLSQSQTKRKTGLADTQNRKTKSSPNGEKPSSALASKKPNANDSRKERLTSSEGRSTKSGSVKSDSKVAVKETGNKSNGRTDTTKSGIAKTGSPPAGRGFFRNPTDKFKEQFKQWKEKQKKQGGDIQIEEDHVVLAHKDETGKWKSGPKPTQTNGANGLSDKTLQRQAIAEAIITGIITAAQAAQQSDGGWSEGGWTNDAATDFAGGFADGGASVGSADPYVESSTVEGTSGLAQFEEQATVEAPDSASSGIAAVSSVDQTANDAFLGNDRRELVKPRPNRLPHRLTVASSTVTRRVRSEIDALINREVKSLSQEFQEYTLSNEARMELVTSHTSSQMDSATVAELRGALVDEDVDAVERIAKKLTLPRTFTENVVPRIKLARTLGDLKKLVQNASSLEEVERFSRSFESSLSEFGLDRQQREELAEQVSSITDSLEIRLELTGKSNGKPGTLIDAPEGEIPVLYLPPLVPAGKPFLIGEGAIVVGAAAAGDLVIGRANASEVIGVRQYDRPSVPNISASQARSAPNSGTVLHNPSESAGSIHYRVNGRRLALHAGESQHLSAGTTWIIDFDRGNGTHARYSLAEGTYTFGLDRSVSELRRSKSDVTIENPSVTSSVHLVVDNEAATIPPGQSLSLTSSYPIVVGFDRGDDGEPIYKQLVAGTFTLGIDQSDRAWDLFEATDEDESNSGENSSDRLDN